MLWGLTGARKCTRNALKHGNYLAKAEAQLMATNIYSTTVLVPFRCAYQVNHFNSVFVKLAAGQNHELFSEDDEI